MRIFCWQLLLRGRTSGTVGAALTVACVVSACTSAGIAAGNTKTPMLTDGAGVTSSSAAIRCAPRMAEARLQALVRDYNAGREVVPMYFSDAGHFERWWDPTLPLGAALGGQTGYHELARHLRQIYAKGVRLKLVQVGGKRNGVNGIALVFGVRRISGSKSFAGPVYGKGLLDCATDGFTVLVIDSWGSPP